MLSRISCDGRLHIAENDDRSSSSEGFDRVVILRVDEESGVRGL